jgi:hypothetical protein
MTTPKSGILMSHPPGGKKFGLDPLLFAQGRRTERGGRRLRVIIEKLLDKAEQGDLQAIKEVFDRLDGKPVQAIERGDIPIEAMTDQQLMAIIRGGSCDPKNEPVLICGPVPPTN